VEYFLLWLHFPFALAVFYFAQMEFAVREPDEQVGAALAYLVKM
jgi:hypothetical protein